MKRILQAAAVTVALLGVQNAWGLGLGEAAVSSDMSSPLRMTLPLLGVAGSNVDLDSVKVDIPGEVEHETLGFADPIRPRNVRVQLVRRGSGASINVTGTSPIREPVLRFVVRVVWPGGQRLREYELIIDPPAIVRPVRRAGAKATIFQAPAAPVATPTPTVASRRPAVSARAGSRYGPVASGDTLHAIARAAYPNQAGRLDSVMQAIVSRNAGAFINADPNRLLRGSYLDLPASRRLTSSSPAEAAPVSSATPADTSTSASSRTYGVGEGDTLYAIARQFAGAGDNLADVVRAIYDGNPGAFIGGDMDRLQAGVQLRIPGSGEAPSVDPVPGVPTASDNVSQEQIASLRLSVEATEAQVSEERIRQSELRGRLDALIAQMETLRARDAQLSERAQALSGELARQNVAISSAQPVAPVVAQTKAPVSEPAASSEQAVVAPATQQASVAPVEQATPAAATAAPVAEDAPAPSRPARPRVVRESASEPGILGFLGPMASGPLLWLTVGLFVTGFIVLVAMWGLRSGGRAGRVAVVPRQRADEEATALKLAEVRERHTESGRFEAAALAAAEEEKPSTVHLTDAARAANLAKEAAVHLAYEDYKAAKACIVEAIRLDPHRDEHKMVLVTVYEATGEHETARAIVDDLVARREQLPGELRQQVEQLRQSAGE